MKRFFIVLVIFTMLSCFIRTTSAQDEPIDWAALEFLQDSNGTLTTIDINKEGVVRRGYGQLTTLNGLERATNLKILLLSGSPISDLTPIANLTQLTRLEMYENQVSDLTPLVGLKNLEELFISSNPLSDISPLARLKGLKSLRLSANQISDLTPIAGLTRLNTLGLGRNQIRDLTPLTGLTQLVWLDLIQNQVNDLTPLTKLTQLVGLRLTESQVSDLTPLAGLISLEALNLTDNQVSDLTPLAGLTQLVGLRLERNQIRDLMPLTELTQLRALTLENNQISALTPLAELTNLEMLSLRYNHIRDLTPLEKMTQLMGLDLSDNQISDLAPLKRLTNLKVLNLGCNQINLEKGNASDLFQDDKDNVGAKNIASLMELTNLEWLDLGGNQISDGDRLRGLPKLIELNLDNTPMSVYHLVIIEFSSIQHLPFPLSASAGSYSQFYILPNGGCTPRDPVQDVPPQDTMDPVQDVRPEDASLQVPLGVKESMAQQLTPMYWINTTSGIIHRLMDAEVENFILDAHNPNSLAIDTFNEKLYWTQRTSNTTGEIWRANLDGSNVELVKELTSTPLEVILDPAGRKLYLVNGWGKIQRMNPDGTGFQPNFIIGLEAPVHITIDVAGGKLYWTQKTSNTTGEIWRANLDGSNVELVKELTSVPLGIAIDPENSKLYLTNGWGKIQRMNPNGTGFQPNFITGLEAPKNIMLDRDNIYWTEGNRIRRVSLNGGNIQDVLTGLGMPIALILDRLIPADMPKDVDSEGNGIAPQLENGQGTEPSKLETDVNEDGVVNIQDLVLVAAHFGKTDVGDADINADGVVNITDLVLVAGGIGQ